jgi:hypothetical protein
MECHALFSPFAPTGKSFHKVAIGICKPFLEPNLEGKPDAKLEEKSAFSRPAVATIARWWISGMVDISHSPPPGGVGYQESRGLKKRRATLCGSHHRQMVDFL